MHIQVMRIQKLTGQGKVMIAARHNLREFQLDAAYCNNIDPTRVGQNSVLRGCTTAKGVANEAKTLMAEAGVKATRKDAVLALEIIFCLSPESEINRDAFFDDSVIWSEKFFGVPVISAVVHNDEAAPHCHVLLLPLIGGRMIGSDLMGGRAKLQAMQGDFHSQVGKKYGLTRQKHEARVCAKTRKAAVELAFDMLETNSGLTDEVLNALLAPHFQNPAPLLNALGLEFPKPYAKDTFVGIMTRPCKVEPKPIGFGHQTIGFDDSAVQINGEPYPV